MILDPERYECTEHGIDVTDQVKAKLDPDRPDVAFGRWSLFGRKASGPTPFQVVVLCPGVEGAEPHRLTIDGQQTP